MEAYRTHYRHDCGLTVRDWRFAARVLQHRRVRTHHGRHPRPIAPPRKAPHHLHGAGLRAHPQSVEGRAVWYVNRTIREQLRLGILERSPVTWPAETVAGKRVMTFDDIPVKRLDAINNTEARVV